MPKPVLGLATSHGPMLTIAPERWQDRVEFDRNLPALAFSGKDYSFDELVEMRRGEQLEKQITTEVMRNRFDACRAAIERLAETYESAQIDKVVIIGNDQMEIFTSENLPAFLLCQAAEIHNIPFSEAQKQMLGPGITEAEPGHHAPHQETYPGLPDLAVHVAKTLVDEEFDIAVSDSLPNPPSSRSSGAPHAFGFIYRQIWRGRPVPHMPVFVNTFYPPNQPTAKRCVAFGRAIAKALASWDDSSRIAVIGSGGLSHFVVDERLDRDFLEMMERGDIDGLANIPEAELRAGTSELKNWITTAALLDASGLKLTQSDYIPCYRSLAGTGNAMAFATWK